MNKGQQKLSMINVGDVKSNKNVYPPNFKQVYPGMPKSFYELLYYYESDISNEDLNIEKIKDCMKRAAFPKSFIIPVIKHFLLQEKAPKQFNSKLGTIWDKSINNYIEWNGEQKHGIPNE